MSKGDPTDNSHSSSGASSGLNSPSIDTGMLSDNTEGSVDIERIEERQTVNNASGPSKGFITGAGGNL